MSKINIMHYIEGAKQAEGLTVIIDVFRAFSLECYLYDMGVKEIRPVGTIEEAFRLKETLDNSLLIGERRGKMCEGFDYGNSPSSVSREKVEGKTIIHTTSAYLVTYLIVFICSILLVSIEGHDTTTVFTAVAATLNNIGPGLSGVGPTQNFGFFSAFAKVVLSFDMLIGRLELFPMLILLNPRMWLNKRKKK